jgi:hypothetical protein
LATERSGGGQNRQRRVGEGHICAASDSVNGFLQFYFTRPQESQKTPIFQLDSSDVAPPRQARDAPLRRESRPHRPAPAALNRPTDHPLARREPG